MRKINKMSLQLTLFAFIFHIHVKTIHWTNLFGTNLSSRLCLCLDDL